jgi:hypothetical protein
MNIWPLNNLSNEEKNDILSKHKHIYNGYRAINPTVSNEQPLYVQDFAKDKDGIVINNKGEVKKYTNFAINESDNKGVCEECGGELYEGECMECGDKMYEEECMECGDKMYEDIYDVEDLNNEDEFDYVQEEDDVIYELEIEDDEFEDSGFEPMESAWANDLDEVDISGSQGIYGGMKKPYDFDSDGPMKGGAFEGEMDEEEEVDEWAAPLIRAAASGAGAALANKAVDYVSSKFESVGDEEDLEEEVDDDLKESLRREKSRIMEMMDRMKVLK